jgi:hypothetical protein
MKGTAGAVGEVIRSALCISPVVSRGGRPF